MKMKTKLNTRLYRELKRRIALRHYRRSMTVVFDVPCMQRQCRYNASRGKPSNTIRPNKPKTERR